ncbi:MAG TPA: phosphate ABC transporter permease PstA [Acidobacteriota bacterium]|nr:phosphate ABC transporter permease PstA [Acidobacteriota bacterium]
MSDQLLNSSPGAARRSFVSRLFESLCLVLAVFGALVLTVLIGHVAYHGLAWLDWQFLTSFPSRFPEQAGVLAAIWGTIWIIGLTAVVAIPVGVAAALYLEEYARPGPFSTLIEINVANLAGVPSVIYGLLGLAVFVKALALGRSILAGALTLALLVLPVIIISARESIRAVPRSIRMASYALGASRWQTVRSHVLPAALPGILTGIILALSRAIGETAPLIVVGALTFVAFTPAGLLDGFTVLPIQIFNWTSRPQSEFHDLAAAASLVLLAVLLLMNGLAIYIRNAGQKGS